MIKTAGNGIIYKNGWWVMLCGSTEVPIRYYDSEGKEITKETAESHQRQPEKETAE